MIETCTIETLEFTRVDIGKWEHRAESKRGRASCSVSLTVPYGAQTLCEVRINHMYKTFTFSVAVTGRSPRAALLNALDVARYPLQLNGFARLGIGGGK